jgi:tetratricopeptide (TPR) repeat protein
MDKSSSTANQKQGTMLRWAIVGAGVLTCLLLFFADKTNLNTLNGTELRSDTKAMVSQEATEGNLLPLAPDPQLDSWREEAENTSGAEKITLLDSIINRLEMRGRQDFAARYADQLTTIQRSFDNVLRAGRLYQQASRMEYVAEDSSLFRSFSDKSIQYLESAVEMDAESEEANYYLGMAYVESGMPQNSMKGIFAIRKVLELNPDNLDAIFSLGVFSIKTGQFDKAEARFKKVLELQTDNYEAMYYLAYARAQQNIPGNSRELLEQVIAGSENNDLKQKARTLLNNL